MREKDGEKEEEKMHSYTIQLAQSQDAYTIKRAFPSSLCLSTRVRDLFRRPPELWCWIRNIIAHGCASNVLIFRQHQVKIQHSNGPVSVGTLLAHIGTIASFVAGAAHVAEYTSVAFALPDCMATLVSPRATPMLSFSISSVRKSQTEYHDIAYP